MESGLQEGLSSLPHPQAGYLYKVSQGEGYTAPGEKVVCREAELPGKPMAHTLFTLEKGMFQRKKHLI